MGEVIVSGSSGAGIEIFLLALDAKPRSAHRPDDSLGSDGVWAASMPLERAWRLTDAERFSLTVMAGFNSTSRSLRPFPGCAYR